MGTRTTQRSLRYMSVQSRELRAQEAEGLLGAGEGAWAWDTGFLRDAGTFWNWRGDVCAALGTYCWKSPSPTP